METWVYHFEQGNRTLLSLLGGKGTGLAEMSCAGLPVPPGFTITTAACNECSPCDKDKNLYDTVGYLLFLGFM
jgi:phosphoenolpyruvate synthase/pyruvate phosphate dikinase